MREIEDNRVFFIGAVILAVILSSIVVYQQFYFKDSEIPDIHDYELVIPIVAMLCFSGIGMGMGVAQTYWDSTRKVSALLATLAVRRRQIFMARAASGLLLVLLGPVLIAATTVIGSKMIGPGMILLSRSAFFFRLWTTVFLFCFTCYCVGLQTGWTSNKITPTLGTLGALGLCVILIPFIVIKGFGWESYAILVFLIAAFLIRAWHKFSTAAL